MARKNQRHRKYRRLVDAVVRQRKFLQLLLAYNRNRRLAGEPVAMQPYAPLNQFVPRDGMPPDPGPRPEPKSGKRRS